MKILNSTTQLFLVALLAATTSCTQLADIPPASSLTENPKLAESTEIGESLKALPRPEQPIMVSVYEFADLTGQHKSSDVPQYSKAVTQGGIAFLKQALFDAGKGSWFKVLERGGLDHLLQERKIIRSMRESYATPDGRALPPVGPMLYSGLLLEGGIIAYDSNTITGGIGARYLGIGADAQYQRDMVTVALRAVSVVSGEVVLSVTTEKTIFSTKVQGGIFKFVGFDKLLEAESGYSVNEPPQLAVRQAIEMAVFSLVHEGVARDLWAFEDANKGRDNLAAYYEEAEVNSASIENTQAEEIVDGNVSAGWYVQVAAVKSFEQEAKPLIERLHAGELNVSTQRAIIGENNYIRILVGPFKEKDNALKGRDLIRSLSEDFGAPFVRFVN